MKKNKLIVLGAGGFLGTLFLDYLASRKSETFSNIYALDKFLVSNKIPAMAGLEYIQSDVVSSDYISNLRINADDDLSIINLVAKDYPVKSDGINSEYNSPFCLKPAEYSDSLVATSTSSYNALYLLQKHSLLHSNVLLVGSIYSHILPKPGLYSEDESLYKPIAYSAGKFSQIPLYKQAAVYMGKYGGRCNCISFGGIQSNQSEDFIDSYSKMAPQSRLVPVDDVLESLYWMLASSPSSVNGAELIVDGGFSII